jgi:hypothetical protein
MTMDQKVVAKHGTSPFQDDFVIAWEDRALSPPAKLCRALDFSLRFS